MQPTQAVLNRCFIQNGEQITPIGVCRQIDVVASRNLNFATLCFYDIRIPTSYVPADLGAPLSTHRISTMPCVTWPEKPTTRPSSEIVCVMMRFSAEGGSLRLPVANAFTYWSAGGVAAMMRSSQRVARSGSGTERDESLKRSVQDCRFTLRNHGEGMK